MASLTSADIVRVGQKLPASPRIFSQLASLLRDMNTGLDEIVALVKMDPGLTSQVLRLSNSVLFGFSEPCTSLEEAINRIGFREVYRMVGLASTTQLFPRELTLYGVAGERVWENALATAIAMEQLARRQGVEDEQTAYTVGLLRSAGKVVLARLAAEPGKQIAPYPGEEQAPMLADWEESAFGINSNQAAAMLMEHWKFAPVIVEAVRHHFDPLARPEIPAEASLLNIAGWVVHQLGKGLPGELPYWRRHPGKFARVRLAEDDAEQTVFSAREGLNLLRSALSPVAG
jgi:HD-like signal output (HDOD) protein